MSNDELATQLAQARELLQKLDDWRREAVLQKVARLGVPILPIDQFFEEPDGAAPLGHTVKQTTISPE